MLAADHKRRPLCQAGLNEKLETLARDHAQESQEPLGLDAGRTSLFATRLGRCVQMPRQTTTKTGTLQQEPLLMGRRQLAGAS